MMCIVLSCYWVGICLGQPLPLLACVHADGLGKTCNCEMESKYRAVGAIDEAHCMSFYVDTASEHTASAYEV